MRDKHFIITLVSQLILALFLCAGWIMNIIKIVEWSDSTGMLAARIIGAFIAPLGGILGWL